MACGAGLPTLAVLTTLGYFLVSLGFTPLLRRIHNGEHREDDDVAAPELADSRIGSERRSERDS